ncbi:HEPN domain-containing protein [bacterium]|nr:HEPN domain-containing protein [bacterium]MBU1753181.1 HEPN domain-containing protein [bacterium]
MTKTSELIDQAEAALEAARTSIELKNYEWAFGHARNSIEFGLKAIIEYYGKSFTKTNIASLIHELKNITQIPDDVVVAAKSAAEMEKHASNNERFCRMSITYADIIMKWVLQTTGY